MTDKILELLKNIDIEDIKKFLNSDVNELLKELKDKVDFVLKEEHLKMVWNYEEKNTTKYSFNEAVKWFKFNMPQGIKTAAIYKDKKDEVINLHLCFLNENNEPLLKGDYPHLVVKTMEIDNEFIANFGDKDLIVLK